MRLFNRTTRKLTPTEVGRVFYDHARKVIDTLEDAEAIVAGFSDNPRGVIRVTSPLGVGRRIVAPLVPLFCEKYPDVDVRLRMSDRKVDIVEDGLDVAFFLGELIDSNLKLRKIMDCVRVLCASPKYLEKHGAPKTPDELISSKHNCLLLRYPRSPEYFWTLNTHDGPRKMEVAGRYDADDADVLTDWALDGRGIVNRPRFDIEQHLQSGKLVEILEDSPPLPISFGCLYPHRRLQDPKIRLFVDFMIEEARQIINKGGARAGSSSPIAPPA